MMQELQVRSQGRCELSGEACEDLVALVVSGSLDSREDQVLVCASIAGAIQDATHIDANQWRFLSDAIWSPIAAVQVLAYRMAHTLADRGEVWAQELLDTAYLEDEVKAWAEAGLNTNSDDDDPKPRDSNGMELTEGDSITLIKDLDVKGMNFTAKRGTLVKNIHLTNNPKHIEGKINGSTIVIVSAYTKKA
jgi:protein PhnA